MGIKVDPSVIFSKDQPKTERIDQNNDIDLYNNSESYQIYQYENVDEQLYNSSDEYNLKVSTDEADTLFSEPVLYTEDQSTSNSVVTGLLGVVIIIQVIFILYIIFNMFSKRRRKYARS